jgi:hypothetical protein
MANASIQLTKKSKGVSNWFTDQWVTNGHFAVRRELVLNDDEELSYLGFEERDEDELGGRLKLIPETKHSFEIFDSGFKYQNLVLFFGKHDELVCFDSRSIKALDVAQAQYDVKTQTAKVYENGRVSMIIKPYAAKGTEVENYFPNHKLLV